MVYLGIALVLVLIVAPIIHVLPSKAQKAAMAKRRTAMSQGIGVELVKIEDPDPDPQKYQTSTARPLPRELSATAYRLHRGRSATLSDDCAFELVRFAGQGRVHFVSDWHWTTGQDELGPSELKQYLGQHVSDLPRDVVRIEEKNNFISLYWQESGEVTEVIDFLKRTAEIQPPV